MILQRLASAIRHQNWSQIIIEILIVVIGIFLGLQVEKWYDGRAALEDERRVLNYLIADVQHTNDYLQESHIDYENSIDLAYEVLDQLKAEELELAKIESFEQGLYLIERIGSIDSYLTSFQDDNLTKIQNVDLKRLINEYLAIKDRRKVSISRIKEKMTLNMTVVNKYAAHATRDEYRRVMIYDFDTLRTNNEFISAYVSVIGGKQAVRDFNFNMWENSQIMLEALKKYQSTVEVGEVKFQ